MAGKTKRKFMGESARLIKRLKRPLSFIKEILPYNYNKESIIEGFKQYYPYLWNELCDRYNLYKAKDDFLVNTGKRKRYKPLKADDFISQLPQVKLWLSYDLRKKHKEIFSEDIRKKKIVELDKKRLPAIEKVNNRISKNTELIQEIEPLYTDAIISSYHKKGISIDGKIEVFNELKKYNNEKTVEFFYKLNDSERNDQIRNMAFFHLQSLGKYVKLRKGFKGKEKGYMIEKSEFNMTPGDLLERIEKDSVQSIKQFDFFISHSSINRSEVIEAIKLLNKKGYTAYCDWTSDNDFLKRELVSEYTKIVLKKRLEQSRNLLFLCTKESVKSEWVDLELEYFENLGKPIYYIQIDGVNDSRLSNYSKFEYETVS